MRPPEAAQGLPTFSVAASWDDPAWKLLQITTAMEAIANLLEDGDPGAQPDAETTGAILRTFGYAIGELRHRPAALGRGEAH